jgi:hypothetical protein
MDPPRIIDDESHFLDRTFPLLAALQRWENEGGAGPGRLPAGFMAGDARLDIAARSSPAGNASSDRSGDGFSMLS